MALVAPTITSSDPESYKKEIEQVQGFADRVHIDLADGHFAPTNLINPAQVWWPDGMTADLHVMFERPVRFLRLLAYSWSWFITFPLVSGL